MLSDRHPLTTFGHRRRQYVTLHLPSPSILYHSIILDRSPPPPLRITSSRIDFIHPVIQSYLMEVYTHRVHQVTSLWEGAWLHFYPGTIQWAQSSPGKTPPLPSRLIFSPLITSPTTHPSITSSHSYNSTYTASTPNHVNYTVTEITEEATITRVLESSIPSILPLADVVVVDSEYFTVVDSVMPGTTSISPLADEVCLASNATTTTFTPREEPSSPTSGIYPSLPLIFTPKTHHYLQSLSSASWISPDESTECLWTLSL